MFYEHKQNFFSNLIFDKRTQKQRLAIDMKLTLSKTYISKIKILRIFALPFIFLPIESNVISQWLSIQFNIYQSHENVVLFLEHTMLATLKLRVEMSHLIYGTRGNWSMTRIIGLLNVDVQKRTRLFKRLLLHEKWLEKLFSLLQHR